MNSGSDEPDYCRSAKFFIPWIGPSLNTIWAGMIHFKRTKLKNDGHWACETIKRKVEPFPGPVHLEFTPQIVDKWHFRYDCTNYAITNKVIEDALVALKIIPGDKPDQVLSTKTNAPIYGEDVGMWVEIISAQGEPAS